MVGGFMISSLEIIKLRFSLYHQQGEAEFYKTIAFYCWYRYLFSAWRKCLAAVLRCDNRSHSSPNVKNTATCIWPLISNSAAFPYCTWYEERQTVGLEVCNRIDRFGTASLLRFGSIPVMNQPLCYIANSLSTHILIHVSGNDHDWHLGAITRSNRNIPNSFFCCFSPTVSDFQTTNTLMMTYSTVPVPVQ